MVQFRLLLLCYEDSILKVLLHGLNAMLFGTSLSAVNNGEPFDSFEYCNTRKGSF